jgi:hypothetical protein
MQISRKVEHMSSTSFREFVGEALKIVKGADAEGIPLRLMGALAVSYHCPKYRHYHEAMDRTPTDIDFASYSKFKNKLTEYLQTLGYKTDSMMMSYPSYAEGKRYMYVGKVHVDVFFDELKMCHRIDWSKRLEADDPTIPLADIVLEKLQIVEINPKDIKDLIILFLEHDVGETDKETLNGAYIADLLSKEWGFYYTATTNLGKVVSLIDEYIKLPDDEKDTVKKRVEKLLNMIESRPKTMGWKMRSRVGTKQKWYTEVEEDRGALKIE